MEHKKSNLWSKAYF